MVSFIYAYVEPFRCQILELMHIVFPVVLQTCPAEWGEADHGGQWDISSAEAQDTEGRTDDSYASNDYWILRNQKHQRKCLSKITLTFHLNS